MNLSLTKMLDKASKVIRGTSDSNYMPKKLLEDFETLEKFYSYKKYTETSSNHQQDILLQNVLS
jgi:hypothetical protein